MIYFAQDSDTLHVKIGWTESDAADRVRALQTGNPSPLVLLGTMPGGKDEERALHFRFATARVAGEWFRPVPELLQLIVKATPERKLSPGEETLRGLHPPRIYLAGKISKHCWRSTLVRGLRSALDDQPGRSCGSWPPSCPTGGRPEPPVWPVLSRAIFNTYDYVGPFFASCDHGCFHGDDSHGLDAQGEFQEGDHHDGIVEASAVVLSLCLEAIRKANLLFAWIDSPDCYGTVVEIGYARAASIPVCVAGPRRFRDMWFVYQAAGDAHHADSPEAGLRKALWRRLAVRAPGTSDALLGTWDQNY